MVKDKVDVKLALKIIALVVFLGWLIRLLVFATIEIDGPSMEPTLTRGERILIEKFSYQISEPARFDIIVFQATEEKNYIKRIIGLPGEKIVMEDDQLYINDQPIREPFLTVQDYSFNFTNDFRLNNLPGRHHVIPEDYYLVLGDNRINSTDSRSLGLIAKQQIIGKASIRYWPLRQISFIE
ncbi:signal peptidase I [Amphibacillus marinus]|uniref:Signal peptidase I n=1 Tax=Amphibacillus marinus TaxID=872970 RepID=A0A1H8HVU6_9BACI|nr:signal peptidase I [Amphibacillus marinus]SEN59818.1 signal peptidase I [Amphibacillus marinus]